ncbi:PREDICTED: cadherin-1-like, partial [Nanorana parkeri]|uniref:cadherin-1-like n=1 Tax=Nanorana parkeri TaxID=125878 RepID=UPI000854D0F4
MQLCYLTLCVLLIKVCDGATEEPALCEPGFSTERYAFTVTRKVLERGRVLGKVDFNTCSAGTLALYSPDDTRFRVFPDGKVTVKRQVTLHDGALSFVLNAWDAARKKHSVTVLVWNEREQQENSHLLKRQKRDWTIPPLAIFENDKGPFPKRVVQISSSQSTKIKTITYSISGEGADRPPVGVFTIDAKTGILMVTRPLDREVIDKYQITILVVKLAFDDLLEQCCHSLLEVHALSETWNVEEPKTFFVHVKDQNDNFPVFTQTIFDGFVTEGSPP